MRTGASRFIRSPVAAKVPEVTLVFWALKLLTTAAGEATSDFLATVGVGIGAVAEIAFLAAAVWLQFRARRYVAIPYWLLALAIATAGTGVSDTMHLTFGIPYAGTTVIWAVVLAAVFWTWNRSEGTLSIHSIVTTRRELFYWATVFATFALGTALGDFTATVLHLGYLGSGIFFGVVFLVPGLAWWKFGMNEIAAFWSAYVVTRPLGASFADYFSKSPQQSGLGFGNGPTALVLLAVFAVLVAYVAVTRNDVQAPANGRAGD